MKTYPIKNAALRFARCVVQDECLSLDKRWIWRESDFTASDVARIADLSAAVTSILCAADGRTWSAVYSDIRTLFRPGADVMTGFAGQRLLLDACVKCGICPV